MRNILLHMLGILAATITLGLQPASAQDTPPIISTIDPPSAVQGQTVQIAFRGKNYQAQATNIVAISPSSGVAIGFATVANSAQLTVSFTIDASATPGERLVTVT